MKKALLTLGLVMLASSSVSRADELLSVPLLTVHRVLGVTCNLAGRDLNGTSLNGAPLEGHGIEYVSLDGVQVGAQSMVAAWIDGSELMAADEHGRVFRGERLVGARFIATLDSGAELALRIDSVQPGSQKWERDIVRYAVSYQAAEGWAPLCGLAPDASAQTAIALQGRWDYGQGDTGGQHLDNPSVFTFGCAGHALAKCVEMGYKPWKRVLSCTRGQGCEKGTLADAHQACTRMLRADYCGDGTPYTVDGIEVNAVDVYGVRTDVLEWDKEAEWGPAGATCLTRERLLNGLVPACLASLSLRACGENGALQPATLIVSEVAR